MSVHHGKSGDIRVVISDTETLIGELKKYTLETSAETIDAKVLSSEWDEHIPGMHSWSATLECHFDAADPAQSSLAEGQSATVLFIPEGESDGLALLSAQLGTITACSIIAENAAIVSYSISIRGSTPLTRGWIDNGE